jgi:hypothetical protein
MVLRALILATLAAAATASAAAATPFLRNQLKPCYVSAQRIDREPVAIDAGGFTPGATVDVSVDGAVQASPIADSNGDLHGQVQAPWVPAGERLFTLQLAERANPVNTLVLQPKVSALSVTIRPARARPSRRVLFSGRGFTEPRPVFAHYVFRGRLRKTVRLAPVVGECGRFAVRARQIPVRHPHTGQWTVDFDQRRRYAGAVPPVRDRLIITVRRVPRSH